ncbi:MAG: hypothetical protein ACKVWV_13980 [Planctomycetota bacterium]
MPVWSISLLLGCTALVLGFCFLLLLRQVGSIELRLDAIVPGGAAGGPPLGAIATVIRVRDLRGLETELGMRMPRPLVLLFVSKECNVCSALLGRVNQIEDASEGVDLALTSDMPAEQLGPYLLERGARGVRAFSSPELLRGWGVQRVPFCVGLAADGSVVKKAVVNDLEDVRAFLATPELAPRNAPALVPGRA